MTGKNRVRLLLLALAGLLFLALIVGSALKARYPVQGKALSEPAITELSLTHSVERGPGGGLIRPPGAVGTGKEKAGKPEPCPT